MFILLAASADAAPNQLRFCLYSEPKTFNPLLVADTSSEAVRYLTAGVLIRVNRQSQGLEPELASSWRLTSAGRRITFRLRKGLKFSDGTPFTSADVAYTFSTLFDPKLHSATADPFLAAGAGVKVEAPAADEVSLTFPAAVSGLERLFDQVGIISKASPKKEMATLGPFYVSEYKPGSEVVLARNPFYWKRDAQGRQLPYLDSVHLYIQQNREMEFIRFSRGELDLMNTVTPDVFEQVREKMPAAAKDLGPSLESEMLWFNQVPKAPIAEYKKAWFASANFRRAVSSAINREDLCRLVYHGHATPAAGPISPANRFWFNAALKAHPFDRKEALQRLAGEGFRQRGAVLYDSQGHMVEFSLITNSGNPARERLAALIQQDLAAIGIRLNIVRLDYSAILERITQTFQYESCLMGLTNVDLDPNGQMNVWLSSSANHQWNPNQAVPGTKWEAEIDRLMTAQASEQNAEKRKAYFDQVQKIIWEQAPFLYLVYRNALIAVSPSVANAQPGVLRPNAYWNIERLAVVKGAAK